MLLPCSPLVGLPELQRSQLRSSGLLLRAVLICAEDLSLMNILLNGLQSKMAMTFSAKKQYTETSQA